MGHNLITTPFSDKVTHVLVEPGRTVEDLLYASEIPPLVWDQVVVTINGIELAQDQWDSLCLRDNDSVSIFITQHGGDSGKMILRLVAVVLIAVFAQWAAPYVASSLAGGAAVSSGFVAGVAAGITVVGVMAINALIPPPSAAADAASAAGNTYFLTGQANRARFYEIVPIVYGTHKMVANLASTVDVFSAGTSSVFSAVYDFGLGGATLSQLKAGDTDLDILSGQTRILKRVPVHINPAEPEQGLAPVDLALISFPLKYQEISLALDELDDEGISATVADCVSAVVEIAFPQGLVKFDDEGLERYAEVKYELSYRAAGGTEWYKPPIGAKGYAGAHLRFYFGDQKVIPTGPFPFAIAATGRSDHISNNSSVEAVITTTTDHVVNDGSTFTVRVTFAGNAYRVTPDASAFTLYDPDTGELFTGGSIAGGITEITPGQIYDFDVTFDPGYQGRAYVKMDSSDFRPVDDVNTPVFLSNTLLSGVWLIDMTTATPPVAGVPVPAPPPPASGIARWSDTVGLETHIQFVEKVKFPYTDLYEPDGNAIELMVEGVPIPVTLEEANTYKGELVSVSATQIEGDQQYRLARYATKYQPREITLVARALGEDVDFTPEAEPGSLGTQLDSRFFTIRGNKALFGVVSIVIPFPNPGQYEIRIIRKTAAAADNTTLNKSVWSKINSRGSTIDSDPRSILNLKKQHTLLELQFQANENISGNVQQISSIVRGEVRPYSGGWLPAVVTRNPAWIVLDILTGYSIQNHSSVPVDHLFDGGWIQDSQIDFASFETLAATCDEEVEYQDAQDNTLTRPRYSCDILIATDAPIIETAQSIMAMCRAQIIFNQQGKYAVFFDEEQTTPRQLFTPQNSWGFTGSRSYMEIPHAFNVEFTAPEMGYQTGVNVVYRPGFDLSNATVFETIQTFGVTNWHQASQYAMYMLAQGFVRSEQFVLNCDLENLVVQRGDMVHIQHDVPLLGGLTCIVSEDSATARVYVDQELSTFPLPWGFTLRRMDGTIVTGDLDAIGPNYVDMSVPLVTEQGELIAIGQKKASGTVTDEYLLTAIDPMPNLHAQLTLVKYDEDVYNTDWGAFPVWDPSFGAAPSEETGLYVFGLKGFADFKIIDRMPISTSRLDWDLGPAGLIDTCKFFNISFRDYGGSETFLLEQIDGNLRTWLYEYDSTNIQYGRGFYTVQPISNLGFFGRAQTIRMGQQVDSTAPAAPTNLIAQYVESTETTTLKWDLNLEPDMQKFMIYSSVADGGIDAADYITSTFYNVVEMFILIGVPMYYYVVAADTSGNISAATSALSTEIVGGTGSNGSGFVPDFAPGFVGGTSNFVYTLNADIVGPDDGEILVNGLNFKHPDGTSVDLSSSPWDIQTPYEGAGVNMGDFWIMYTEEDPLTRWSGSSLWGNNQSNFVVAVHDDTNGWRVREDDGTYYDISNAGYSPDMMRYDGITGYYTRAGFSVSGNKVTVVCSFAIDSISDASVHYLLWVHGGGFERVSVAYFASNHANVDKRNKIQVQTQNSAGTKVCAFLSVAGWLNGNRNVLFYEFDGDAGTGSFTINGANADDAGNAARVAPIVGVLGTAAPEFLVGAATVSPSFFASGDIGFLGYGDVGGLSSSSFMSGSSPKQLDEISWSEWGGQPLFWNDDGMMELNKGSAGNMSKVGSVTPVSILSGPGIPLPTDCIIAACYKNNPLSTGIETIVPVTGGLFGADGADGSDGTDGVAVDLSFTVQAFVYDPGPAPASSTFTAAPRNYSGTPFYEFFVDDSSVQNSAADTYVYTPPSDYADMPDKIEVQLRDGGIAGAILARDQTTVYGLKAGTDAILFSMSNEAHTLPTTNEGVVDYEGSGTLLEVRQGEFKLDPVDPALNPGEWTVNAIASAGITVGTIGLDPDDNTRIIVGDASNMTAGRASIEFTANGRRVNGEIFSEYIITQSLAKSNQGADGLPGADGADGADGSAGVSARSVSLSAATLTFAYDASETNPDPVTSTITAIAFNTDPAAKIYYKYYINDVAVPETPFPIKDNNVYIYTPDPDYANMPEKFEVEIYEGDESTYDPTILATDQITLAGLLSGGDALTVSMSNEAHTLATTSAGVVDYVGSGSEFRAWQGATALTWDDVAPYDLGSFYVIVDPTWTGAVVPGVITGAVGVGTLAVADSMTADNVTIDFDINVTRLDGVETTIKKTQSLSKSIEGLDGIPGTDGTDGEDGADGIPGADGADGSDGIGGAAVSLSSESLTFQYDPQGENPDPATVDITAEPIGIGAGLFPYYEYFIDDVSQSAGIPIINDNVFTYTPQFVATSMPQKFEVELWEGTIGGVTSDVIARDQITLAALVQGVDAVTAIVSNEAHTLPTTALGVVTYAGSGTDFNVWQGVTQVPYSASLTSSPSFNVVIFGTSSITPNPAPTTVATFTRRYGNHSNMTADNASIIYTINVKLATGATISLTKTQSFAKSIEGTDGDDGTDGTDGTDGADGVNATLDPPSDTIGTDLNGHNYARDGSGILQSPTGVAKGGTYEVYNGNLNVAAFTTYSVVGGAPSGSFSVKTQNGLSFYIDTGGPSAGLFFLIAATSSSWTSDEESFTVRAAFGGNNYDRKYTITKVRGGSNDVQLSPITVFHTAAAATASWEVDNDGTVDIFQGSNPLSGGIWLNAGAAVDYEVMWQHVSPPGFAYASGSATREAWLNMNTDRVWRATTATSGAFADATGSVSIRRVSDGQVLVNGVTIKLQLNDLS